MSDEEREPIAGGFQTTHRLTELEIEVARLTAELDEARGEDAVAGTSRFLMLAATTVDMAVANLTTEAEAAVTEARGEVERLRAQAEEAAHKARAEAEQAAADALAEADAAREAAALVTIGARRELEDARRSALTLAEQAAAEAEEKQLQARTEADQIMAVARQEASTALVSERQRFAREVDALTGVREALIQERRALEEYHGQLESRVRDLARAMVSFMDDSSDGGVDALARLATPQIGSAPVDLGLPRVTVPEPAAVLANLDAEITDEGYPATTGSAPEAPLDSTPASIEPAPAEPQPVAEVAPFVPGADMFEPKARPVVEPIAPQIQPQAPESAEQNPWREFDPNESPAGPLFGGATEPSVLNAAGGADDLFAPARPGEGTPTEVASLARVFAEGESRQTAADFESHDGVHGVDARADAQFQDFIDGDVDDDASRTWFLRTDDV